MKHLIKDYFTFNKRERNGVFVLLSIIIFLLLFLSFYGNFLPEEKVDFTEFDKQIARLDSLKNNSFETKEAGVNFENTARKITLFTFDPNELPPEKWLSLGLSEKQIKIIKNYESKGGKFYKKEDLKKIYGIPERKYKELEPFIVIPSTNKPTRKEVKSETNLPDKKNTPVIIELNNADSSMLVTLPGIGPVFAQRIIKYRNSLGGFISGDQLKEVYGITPETFAQISSRVTIENNLIKRININTTIFNDLKKHPYIKYNIANALINYRKAHGNYNAVEDIRKIDIITPEIYQRIESYLKVE